MGKSHCDHRVVTRDQQGKIVRDDPFDSFATGEPAYQVAVKDMNAGQEVALQHGARVIFSAKG
jgi:hypothetical protein